MGLNCWQGLKTKPDGDFTLEVDLDLTAAIQPKAMRARLLARSIRANGLPLEPDANGWVLLPVENKLFVEGIWQ